MGRGAAGLKLGVALIGLGDVGARHLRIAQDVPRMVVRAICDLDRDRLASAQATFGLPGTTDYRAVLDSTEVEAIFVLTPPNTHRQIVEHALAAGKHVFCEKPLAHSLADARAIESAALSSGRVVMVGFQERFNPALRTVRRTVQEGKLGPLELITVSGRVSRKDAERRWMHDRLAGGGALLESSVHSFDLVRWITGLEFERVYAETVVKGEETEFEETVAAVGRLHDGPVVQIDASFALPRGALFDSRLDVIGRRGSLSYDLARQPVWIRSEAEIDVNGRVQSGATYIDNVHYSLAGAYIGEHLHFIETVLDGASCEATVSDGVRSLAVAAAAGRSAREGRPADPSVAASDLVG